MDDPDKTLEIKGLPQMNELDYVQYKYDEALKVMMKDPSEANIAAFGDANRALFETQDKYRIGNRLLVEYNHKNIKRGYIHSQHLQRL